LVDDGTGNDIKIPVVLISKSDGDKIKRYLTENYNESTEVHVIIKFQLVNIYITFIY